MLRINVPQEERFNESTNEFVTLEAFSLELEHSLVALSKWESKFEKPFLTADEKTDEETLAYIEAMIITPDYPPDALNRFTTEDFQKINAHIESKKTATWFNDTPTNSRNREVITSELIYYWMIAFNVPMKCENWHLNRLFTLLKVCNVQNAKANNSKPQKPTSNDLAARRALNAQRKRDLGTSG